MNRKTTYLSAITIGIASLLSTASAQSASNAVPAEILACADEIDVMQRLSCYDREVAAAQLASEAPLPEPAPPVADTPAPTKAAPMAASIPATAMATQAIEATSMPDTGNEVTVQRPESSNAEADFGLNVPAENIVAIVVEIRERPYGELVIRLDNGQVWEQKHVDRGFRLKVGETVAISKGMVSGYRLSGSGNRSIQVQRRN